MSQAMIRKATGKTQQGDRLVSQRSPERPRQRGCSPVSGGHSGFGGTSEGGGGHLPAGPAPAPGLLASLYDFLGDFYSRHQEYTKAVSTLSTGITLAAETPSLYFNLGATYFRMSRWDDAAKAFEKSLAVKPTATAYANLGTVRFYQGNYAESAKQMELAIRLQPANFRNWGNRGDALWQLPGHEKQANAAFDQAATLASQQLTFNPDDAGVRKSYALYLAKLGRAKEAAAEIRRAVAQMPKDGLVQFYAARVFTVTGDREAALTALQTCVALHYSLDEIRQEPDFGPLRTDQRYQLLTGRQWSLIKCQHTSQFFPLLSANVPVYNRSLCRTLYPIATSFRFW